MLPRPWADLPSLDCKSVPARTSVVDLSCFYFTLDFPFAKRTHVNIRFCNYTAFLHPKKVATAATMIYLTGAHKACHGFVTIWTNVLPPLLLFFGYGRFTSRFCGRHRLARTWQWRVAGLCAAF